MEKDGILRINHELLKEIEEEDIAINLFTAFSTNETDLHFFTSEDRAEVKTFLKILIDESAHHKQILARISELLQRRVL